MRDASSWVSRYLALLGLPEMAEERPSLEALRKLTRAQVQNVPFENITAILRRAGVGAEGPVPPVDLEALLASWEAGAGGGVCFDATPMFRRLLDELGYQTSLALARISFMGSHQAVVVTLDSAEYLVDVANGAPFFDPIPLDRETIVRHGALAWRFTRESPGGVLQDRYIDGQWTPFCWYDLQAPEAEAIEAAYQRHHLPGETWVVGNLTLVRCTDDAVVRLRDTELIRFSAEGATTERFEPEQLPRVAAEVFGVPSLPIARAHAVLEELRRGGAIRQA
jgi:arylamine N-acetyltransferase